MSATRVCGRPCSSVNRTHRIRAGEEPEPITRTPRSAPSRIAHAASKSGLRCLVADGSSKASSPSTGGSSRTAVARPLDDPRCVGGIVLHDQEAVPEPCHRGGGAHRTTVLEPEAFDQFDLDLHPISLRPELSLLAAGLLH